MAGIGTEGFVMKFHQHTISPLPKFVRNYFFRDGR